MSVLYDCAMFERRDSSIWMGVIIGDDQGDDDGFSLRMVSHYDICADKIDNE